MCLQLRQLGQQECLFYKVVQRQNHRMVADFILRFGADICCLTCQKILKSDIAKVTANVIGAHFFTHSFTCAMRWVYLQGSAATLFRWCGKFNSMFVYRTFMVTTVKESLKSIHVWQCYATNKKGCSFFDSQCIVAIRCRIFSLLYFNVLCFAGCNPPVVFFNRPCKKWEDINKLKN